MRKLLFIVVWMFVLTSIVSAADVSTNGYFYLPGVGDPSSTRVNWVNANEATDGVIKSNVDFRVTPSSVITAGDNISWTGNTLNVTGGSGAVDSVNSQTGVVVLDADDISDSSTTNKYTTASDISKLLGIESSAEVNNISDVNATDLTDGGDTTLHDHDGISENTTFRTTPSSVITAGTNISWTGNTLNVSTGTSTDNDAIHDNVASEISAITEKASPVSADLIIIEDSADSNNKKKVQIGNLPGGTGSVSYDEIEDAASNALIDFFGYSNDWTNIIDGGDVFTISNTDADLTSDTTLIKLQYADDGDSNGSFFKAVDDSGGTPNTVFEIDYNGNTSLDGTLTIADNVSQYFGDSTKVSYYTSTENLNITATGSPSALDTGIVAVIGDTVGGGTNLSANQEIFEVGYGDTAPTGGSYVEVFSVDKEGDVTATAYYGDGSNLTGIVGGAWTVAGDDIHYTTGNVGIGTSVPTEALQVKSTTGDSFKATDTSNNLIMVIKNDGNVGIGTSAPQYNLDISGDVSMDTTQFYMPSPDGTVWNCFPDNTGSWGCE